jgi:CRISPR-associated protein Csy1
MSEPDPGRRALFRAVIEQFLQERRDAKLDKLPADDPKYEALTAAFERDTWLESAAYRVGQIQAVTHTLKAIHPDARGTNLYADPAELHPHAEVGSHALDVDFAGDVVGNAAALDVYKFLRIEVEQKPLLDWILAGDADATAALSDDADQAAEWRAAFAGLIQSRGEVATHTRAKQIYWLVGEDPCRNTDFHLLAPLYASSLAHAVFATINEDRFGDEAKAARKARRERRDHAHGYADYPGLAAQKLGGTKPQNISQLNSERGGNNYLLGSLPPTWKTRNVREPWGQDSVFPRFGYRPLVRETVDALRRFLDNDPDPTMDTRDRRDELTDTIIDELVCFARELHEGLNPGWSADPKCELVEAERLWLDPGRAETDLDFRQRWLRADWPADIGHRFGNWLNARLKGQLPVGDIEQRHWSKELLIDDAWADWLYRQRHKVSAMEPEMAGGEA